MKVLMVDPPGGWQYGFPKPVHEEFHTLGNDFDMEKWLVSEGYPQSEIDALGRFFHCRFWEQEVDDEWYEGRAARNNMSSPGDRDYES